MNEKKPGILQDETYILEKDVDWSVINEGFSIPITYQFGFYDQIKKNLKHGEKLSITLFFNNREFSAKLVNQPFDKRKYPKHKDILQIRYSKSLSNELKQIFFRTYKYLKIKRESRSLTDNSLLPVPDDLKESILIYGTEIFNEFYLDSITLDDKNEINFGIKEHKIQEEEVEVFLNKSDDTAGFYEINKILKLRKLNRALGNALKELYHYKCQICGNNFGKNYNTNIVECHHIIPFVQSLNNDSDNLLIICPNHHRIIHKTNPIFHKRKLTFEYPNGLEERLLINKHLE